MFLFELLSLWRSTRPCHTAVFNFTLSWRALCFLPGGWFTVKIKQNKLLIHPIFYLSSPFVPQLLVTAYCNIALVVLYPMMSAPPTRNSQNLCCKCNIHFCGMLGQISHWSLTACQGGNYLLREFPSEQPSLCDSQLITYWSLVRTILASLFDAQDTPLASLFDVKGAPLFSVVCLNLMVSMHLYKIILYTFLLLLQHLTLTLPLNLPTIKHTKANISAVTGIYCKNWP